VVADCTRAFLLETIVLRASVGVIVQNFPFRLLLRWFLSGVLTFGASTVLGVSFNSNCPIGFLLGVFVPYNVCWC